MHGPLMLPIYVNVHMNGELLRIGNIKINFCTLRENLSVLVLKLCSRCLNLFFSQTTFVCGTYIMNEQ